MPINKREFPPDICFLADLEAVSLPEQYLKSPFYKLLNMFKASPFKRKYQYIANSNIHYSVHQDFLNTLEKAKAGEDRAIFEIACMYFYGFASEDNEHGKLDYVEASKWLKMLINKFEAQDDIPEFVVCAEIMLANMYYSGTVIGEEQSFSKTVNMLENLLQKRSDDNFGFEVECEKSIHMMINGMGTAFEFEELLRYLEKYEMSCSNHAKNSISKFYMRYGLYEKAIKVMESVDEDYPDIDYRLGDLYLQGLHCNPPKPDVYRAEYFLSKAAYCGHLEALHTLLISKLYGASLVTLFSPVF